MNPADIKNYRFLQREIHRAEKRLDYLRETDGVSDAVKGSCCEYPFTSHTFKMTSSTNSRAIAAAEKEIERLRMLKREIESLTLLLEDPIELFLVEQYMKGIPQTETAAQLDIAPSTISRHLQRICDRFS